MQRKEINSEDRRTKYTRSVIREALMGLLRIKPYSKISVTELCRLADINRGTFYIHYFDVDDVLDDILEASFSDVSGCALPPCRNCRMQTLTGFLCSPVCTGMELHLKQKP